MYSYLVYNLTHEALLYNLDWCWVEWQLLTKQFYDTRDAREMEERHVKPRILDTLSDQDLWVMARDKRKEKYPECIKLAEYFERELNHRKNPERFVKEDLSKIKEQIPILDVIESYAGQIRYRPRQLVRCMLPDHADSSPSFSINTQRNLYRCFGCSSSGSQVDFIMAMERCDLKTAINKLKSFL